MSLEPPWRKIFTGESVTLTCNVATDQGKGQYVWYKNGRRINGNNKDLTIQKAGTRDTGNYQCTASNSDTSDGVRLEVSDDYVILQVPYLVFEEDNLSLRCRTSGSYSVKSVTFYKNRLKLSSEGRVYTKKGVDLSSRGKYRCDLVYKYYSRVYSDEADVIIQELFPDPTISVSPYSVTEGDNMAASCDTTVHPLRSAKKLHFAFYKNGQKVREFSSSNEYHVGSAHLEDAGDYTCEAKTQTGNIRKMSQRLNICIINGVSKPRLTISLSEVEVGDNVDLVCESDNGSFPTHYTFYHMRKVLESVMVNQKGKAELKLSNVSLNMSGLYYCKSTNETILSEEVTLSVIEPVSGVRISVENDLQELKPGDNLTLNCSVERGTSPTIRWLHDEEEVDDDSELYQIIETGEVLFVQSVQRQHGGTYQCLVSNQLSPNTTVQSKILTINVSDKNSSLTFLVLSLAVALLVLLLLCAFLVFKYRQKLSPSLGKCCLSHQAGSKFPNAQNRNPLRTGNEDTHGQDSPIADDHHNVPRDLTTQDNMCYTYIDFNYVQKAPAAPATKKNHCSVTYAVVKHVEDTLKAHEDSMKDTADSSASIYQNFNSK
ncbi:Fc receptor-like protein 5 [Discoglossus pictus]